MSTPFAAKVRLGISTCPNDTFAFHAILSQKIDTDGVRFEIDLLDIQELNERLAAGVFDVAKVSFYAALAQSKSLTVLASGAAIGHGVGPVLLSNRVTTLDELRAKFRDQPARVLCPGDATTATFLARTVLPFKVELRQVLFSEIIPQLIDGQADFGACIHEARFVWKDHGLHLIADLGELWHERTSEDLPLGGLVARNSLPRDLMLRIQSVVRDSILYAQTHRAETIPTMRKYAQEFSDDVLMAHADLYVNELTKDMGGIGQRSLAAMHRLAVGRGLLTPDQPPLTVLTFA